jgi:hypothetical protein
MTDKLSPNGARIFTGEGLASVKQSIEAAFNDARVPDATNVIDGGEISIEDPVVLDNLIKQIPPRPLREHSTPATVGRHRGGVYHVVVPKKSAQVLIDEAMAALEKPKPRKP